MFLVLLGSLLIKAAFKHVGEINLNFINILQTAFTLTGPKSATVLSAFEIFAHKSCI